MLVRSARLFVAKWWVDFGVSIWVTVVGGVVKAKSAWCLALIPTELFGF